MSDAGGGWGVVWGRRSFSGSFAGRWRGVVGVLDGELSGLVVGRLGRFSGCIFFSLGQRERRQATWLASTPRAAGESNCFPPESTPAAESGWPRERGRETGRRRVGPNDV